MSESYVISTDLDGTLLDHHNYSWASAEAALEYCRQRNVPVVLNTSKTASESIELQSKININAPLIVENGSALLISETLAFDDTDSDFSTSGIAGYKALVFGSPRQEILKFLADCRQRFAWQFEGFSDWDTNAIVEKTGLSIGAARRASEKHYSEPFLWQDSDANFIEFEKLVSQANFKLLSGGRFLHIQGQTDKARPLRWLMKNSHRWLSDTQSSKPAKLICLGDSQNDTEMLKVADYPVWVRKHDGKFPELEATVPVYRTQAVGPAGWNEAVTLILNNNR